MTQYLVSLPIIVLFFFIANVGKAQTIVSKNGRVVVVSDYCKPNGPPGSCAHLKHRAMSNGKELSSMNQQECGKVIGVTNRGTILCKGKKVAATGESMLVQNHLEANWSNGVVTIRNRKTRTSIVHACSGRPLALKSISTFLCLEDNDRLTVKNAGYKALEFGRTPITELARAIAATRGTTVSGAPSHVEVRPNANHIVVEWPSVNVRVHIPFSLLMEFPRRMQIDERVLGQ